MAKMPGLALKHVNLSTDVYFVCLNHAMSTEGEEVVGLLVGEVDENRVAHVVAIVLLRRSDKRKDRVEISPEQLSSASSEAERLALSLKRPVRVVGWYHSHPKLTVWPSPIDVNTQDSYQLMDEGFIGVIFSVFNEDPNKKGGRIQMTCFQAQTLIDDTNIERRRLDIPVHLVPATTIHKVCINALIQLPRYLCQEEQLAYQYHSQRALDYLTKLHNSSVYIKSMGQIAEVICGPLLKMLEDRLINNEFKRNSLMEKKKELLAFVEQARIEKVHREKEQLKPKEVSLPSTSIENPVIEPSTSSAIENPVIKPSTSGAIETQVKKLGSENLSSTSNPTESIEMSDIENSAKRSDDNGTAAKFCDSHSPEKSDITSDESENNSPDVGTSVQADKMEPKSSSIAEKKETDTPINNNDSFDKKP